MTARKAKHVPNLTLEQYHRRPEWSRSQLESLRESAPLFYGRYIADPPTFPFKRSEALDHGTVTRAALRQAVDKAGTDGRRLLIPADGQTLRFAASGQPTA